MIVRSIGENERALYDAVVPHPLQSFSWGEFRAKTGTEVERIGIFDGGKLIQGFQITFHKLPYTSFTVGYFPKGTLPDEQMLSVLQDIGARHHALFIKLEPNIASPVEKADAHAEITSFLLSHGCVEGKPLFTRYSFQLSLSHTEEELLAAMHQKTRYNINLAERKGVKIEEDTSKKALEEYLTLLDATTKRQGFYAHSKKYYEQMFDSLSPSGMLHIFKATYEGQTLSVWIVFVFNKKLYYPYGASSREHREVMANNLLAWEVIKFGKKQGCTDFDMWGSLGPNPNPKDPWFGFHKFKEGYGGTLVHFVGSYDLVFNSTWYSIFRKVDSLRWKILHLKSQLLFS
jgi:lipid II:glycine glycyltransferase (peptidoglycan interpeptide bridge formation enzyme)